MYNEKMFELGNKRSIIREIFEYSKKRAMEIGKDKVFDFSLGNPSVPAPAEVNEAIKERGRARILLSTGASQFAYLEALVQEDVDWSKVEMFHLDEYVGISVEHQASFKKYLIERFTSKVSLKKAYFVDGMGDIQKNIAELTNVLNEHPIDVGAIGIGENAHIAFNDPPADFDDTAA